LTVTRETVARTDEPAPRAELAVEAKGLVRRFGEREALYEVDATLARAHTLVVFGPNGAGKTTFLRVLATLLLPHDGSVRVLGRDLPRDAHEVRAQIGFIGHEPLLYKELTGRENLMFYARLYDLPRPEERVQELLDTAALSRRADEPLHALSRGMVQRLAICRAVLHGPELLLLDEPLAGLDPDAEDLVEPLIGRDGRHTRVLVTHDIDRGLAQADRVLGLRDGRALLDGPARDFDASQVRALYGHSCEVPD
jgi:heme exporter protein A